MKLISPEEQRSLAIKVLLAVDLFCKEHGMHYYLAFGTLLGAVRHHGFIPWDDDIDIWMPRPDYDRFLAEFEHPYCKVISSASDQDYPLDFAKVHDTRTVVTEEGGDGSWGIFVDVFPLDGVPTLKDGARIQKKVKMIRHLVANQRFTRKFRLSGDTSFSKKISIIVGRLLHPFISVNRLLVIENKIMKKYCLSDCDYMCDFTDLNPLIVPKSFLECGSLEFEGHSLSVSLCYDEWLSSIYGDYMQLPPVEKRISNHGMVAFWK